MGYYEVGAGLVGLAEFAEGYGMRSAVEGLARVQSDRVPNFEILDKDVQYDYDPI